ncbi:MULTISPECIES: RHS repeat-associated core domain-containing protein [Gammaproteobacteria]|uniref:RHS repeat-associated core domain-containing protein n=1 Tax=Gammaproteobacteria TaxID=1236 RepID=UPI000DD052F7|nr:MULTISPECIES: RHS repeat-associated core domain-containing protein [Gammaproteobacteria]RTE86188.1 hypothetical protein DQX04_06350 [Aliidiomarina sp. B3213]TCZ91540.1 hypothetical protein EYQ95_06360 [Lysobacter sp. N42]
MASMTYQYGAGSSLTTNYVYNALGQRVRKSGGAATATDFIYSPSGQLLAEGNNGQYTKYYIYFGGTLVGYIKGTTLYYVHTDHLGRPEAITNSSKSVVWRAEPTTFGVRNVVSSSIGAFNIGLITGILPFTHAGHASHVQNRSIRFCPGQYWDSEKQSWYNLNRDYDPETGRYLQSDPIGLAGGFNTYVYVGGNPVNLIDPLGLAQICSRPLMDFNKQWGPFRHDQIFYENGENSGYFSETDAVVGPGVVQEDDDDRYQCEAKEYDDELLKNAEERVQTYFSPEYNLATNNCQHYVQEVLRIYDNMQRDLRYGIQ